MTDSEQPKKAIDYISQAEKDFRERLPVWMKQLPYLRFPKQKENFQLIDPDQLQKFLTTVDPEAVEHILEDIHFLDHELLRLFRDRDYRASKEQNRYRLYQIGYMVLAAVAGIVGALQALAFTNDPERAAFFAFIETVVAAFVTFLATISGREQPLPAWLMHRRRAEYLRREYFRYLLNLPPYDEVSGYHRRQLLSARAADINRGVFPDVQATPPA